MKPLRLLVVINNYPPDLAGGAAVIGDMCQGLSRRGFEVTVRCAYPYYPEWRDKSGRNGLRVWRYRDGEVSVERHGLYIPHNPNSMLHRLVHESSFLLSLLRGLWSVRRFDVVMAYCPAVTCIAFGVAGKLVHRRPLWLNVQDLAADAAAASGLVKRPGFFAVLRALQNWLFNRAEVWSTISPVMAERLAPLRRRGQPLLFLPNWLNQSLAGEIARHPRKHGEWPRGRPLRLLYAGNIGKKQNLLALLQILRASALDFEFRVNGSGAQAAETERWIRGCGDPRFVFGPFLDERGFAGALHGTDFFVITETPESGASFMPSKLIPGIASGTPILAVCDSHSPLGHEVLHHGLGPCVGWHEVDEIAGLLQLLAQNPQRYSAWVHNAYRRAEQYRREPLLDRTAENLRKLSAREPPASDY